MDDFVEKDEKIIVLKEHVVPKEEEPDIISWPETPTSRTDLPPQDRLSEFCTELATMSQIPADKIVRLRKLIYDTLLDEFNISPDDLTAGTSIELTRMKTEKIMKIITSGAFLKRLIELYDVNFLGNRAQRFADIVSCNIEVCFENKCTKTAGKCWPGKSGSEQCPTIKIQLSAKVFKLMMEKSGDNTKKAFGCECNNILDCVQLIFEHEYIHAFIDCFCNKSRNIDNLGNYTGKTDPKSAHSKTFMSIVHNLFGHSSYMHELLLE